MGKHSDPDPRWFWLSLAGAAGKALLVLVVLAGAGWGLTRMMTGNEGEQAPSVTPTAVEPTFDPAEQDTGEPTFDPAAPAQDPLAGPSDADGGEVTPSGVTVQVLDASGLPDTLEQAVAALEQLGYEVVTTGRAVRGYERTTVFWSQGLEQEALRLRRTDARFGVVEPNERLDPAIDLHVVVGADWTGQ